MDLRNPAAAALFLIGITCALAQPNPYGCHYFHSGHPQFQQLSEADRDGIAATIARSDTFDIIHYDISIDVTDYLGQTIQAATTVTFRALMAGQEEIRFDLLELQVDSVTGDGISLPFDHDGEFLRVDLPYIPEPGVDHQLVIHYGGHPHKDPYWGGFYFEDGYIYNLGIGLTSIPPNFGKVWYPCFDSFVERATYSYHVKSAGSFRFHGQGEFMGEVILGGDTVIRSYALAQPIPTHLSAIAVANYQTHAFTHTGAFGEVPVTLKAKPSHINGMVEKFNDVGAAIDVCEHWFGEHAFDRVGYVQTTDGALEIPTNIAYPQHMNAQSELLNRALYTHELGHHWWGDIVTPYVHNDMWLKEGPAEYSGHLVEEWLFGQDGFEIALKDNLLYVLRQAHLNDEGFQALSPMPDEHIYGSHTYYKGALVLHNLRGYLGDDLFRTAMTAIQTNLGYSTVTADQFKNALETYTQVDLDPFFNAWVYGRTYSVFEVRQWSAQQQGTNWNVSMEIGQKVRGGELLHEVVPIEITLIGAGGETEERSVTVGGVSTSVAVDSPFEPVMVIINRHQRLNLARLDQEIIVPANDSVNWNLTYAEARLFSDRITAESLVRIEHLWVAPDQGPLSADVLEISDTHYWNIDGSWPEGSPLRVRFSYYGYLADQLDHELFNGNEFGWCVLYRRQPSDAWEVYADQEVSPGNLINGQGSVMVSTLRPGQYTFGKTTGFVSVSESRDEPEWKMAVHPVPAQDRITVTGNIPTSNTLVLDIHSIDGKRMSRHVKTANGAFSEVIDVSGLVPGAYLLRAVTTGGFPVGTSRFEVVR